MDIIDPKNCAKITTNYNFNKESILAAKDINKRLDEIFASCKKSDILTFEDLAKEFEKQPTLAQSRKILKLSKKYKINIVSSSEYAKHLSEKERKRRELAKKNALEEHEEEFDFLKEKELLEWSRSDSPVRMYLREMGKKYLYLPRDCNEGFPLQVER